MCIRRSCSEEEQRVVVSVLGVLGGQGMFSSFKSYASPPPPLFLSLLVALEYFPTEPSRLRSASK
jgi:hypothetical protein